jgi:hypothetical protein
VETVDDQAMAIVTNFFYAITLSSMPPRRLAFKVGIPIILLRNLDVTLGLSNGISFGVWHGD